MKKLKIALIGIGKQATKEYLPLIANSNKYDLVAICDKEENIIKQISLEYKVDGFCSLSEMLSKCIIDVCLIAVPHSEYLKIIKQLVYKKIHIIKEKPFAMNINEAIQIQKIVNQKVFLGIIVQRRFNPVFQTFNEYKNNIGKIYSIEIKYFMNIKNLDDGWRSSLEESGGGALLDMGYHMVDLIIWYFGLPKRINARMSKGNRINQEYDVEDTVHILFDLISNDNEKVSGNLLISRTYPYKKEELLIVGRKGSIKIEPNTIKRFSINGDEIESLFQKKENDLSIYNQLDYFYTKIILFNNDNDFTHLKHMAFIQASYDSDIMNKAIIPNEILEKYKEI